MKSENVEKREGSKQTVGSEKAKGRIVRAPIFRLFAVLLASLACVCAVRVAGLRRAAEGLQEAGAQAAAAEAPQDAKSPAAAVESPQDAKTQTPAVESPQDAKTPAAAVESPREVKTQAAAAEAPQDAKSQIPSAEATQDAKSQTPAAEAPQDGGAQILDKRVALTFDDGPHPIYTAELLDGLKERGIRATFFVIGENIPGNEDVIRRMDAEGHLIGNHTYDHVKISDLSGEAACEQIEKTSSLIRGITGKDTEFVRPPFGEWNGEMECEFVMIPVLWDVDSRDWTTRNVSDIVRRVLKDTEDGSIILMHDYYDSSVKAALEIADALSGQGYRFVTVDELILE